MVIKNNPVPGLWELIEARSPDEKIFSNADYDNYAEIIHSTNALRRKNDESETKTESHQKLEMKTHIKTNLGLKLSVYRKRFNTFSSPHHFTIRPCCARRKMRYADSK